MVAILAKQRTYLLILGYIRNGEEAGYEPELGMVEDDELGVGQEAVVALVGQARAVLLAVLHHITHCNEDPIFVFTEKEFCGLSPNFHIHVSVSVSYLYFPRIWCTYFPQQNSRNI
jgi:hypothetical protein